VVVAINQKQVRIIPVYATLRHPESRDEGRMAAGYGPALTP
jgi:hypothetical protein